MKTTLYHDDLAKEIGAKIGKPATKTKKLIKIFEELIAADLKAKERVKLQNFGTFYLIHQESKHIIQIRTKQRRILLGTTIVKFRPSLKIKHQIRIGDEEEVLKIVEAPSGKPVTLSADLPQNIPITKPAPRSQASVSNAEEIPVATTPKEKKPIEIKVETAETESETSKPQKYERVDSEKIRAQIRSRLQAINQPSTKADELLFKHHILETSPEGRLFSLAFKRIERLGENALGFYLFDANQSSPIYYGRPRKKLASVPKQNALEFLNKHLEIESLDFPQERFVKFYTSSKMDSGWIVFVHTLPLAEGASVYVKLVKKL